MVSLFISKKRKEKLIKSDKIAQAEALEVTPFPKRILPHRKCGDANY